MIPCLIRFSARRAPSLRRLLAFTALPPSASTSEKINPNSKEALTQLKSDMADQQLNSNKPDDATDVEYAPLLPRLQDSYDPSVAITAEVGTVGGWLIRQYPTKTATQLRDLLESTRPTNAHYTIAVLHFLLQNNRLDSRCVYPAAKLIARLMGNKQANDTILNDPQLTAKKAEILTFLHSEAKNIAIAPVRRTVEVYLRVCTDPTSLENINEWPKEIESFRWDEVLESSHCFRLLTALALVQAPSPQVGARWLGNVCRLGMAARGESFFSAEHSGEAPSMWPTFMEALSSDEAGDQLMHHFFDHMASHEMFEPNMLEFKNHILPALRKHGRWQSEPAKAWKGEETCEVCGHRFEKKSTLTSEEFDTLREEFDGALLRASRSKTSGSIAEYKALMRLVSRLRTMIRPDKRPLVIDGLNLLHVSHLNLFYKVLFELVQANYGPILLAIRNPKGHKEHLMVQQSTETTRALDVHYFMVDRRSSDDLYMITAALMLGPETHLLSNDEYHNHANGFRQPGSIRLLNVWTRSNIIRITPRGDCMYPSMFYKAVQKSPLGYHLFVQPRDSNGRKFLHLPFASCLQTKWVGGGGQARSGELEGRVPARKKGPAAAKPTPGKGG